MKNIVVSLLLFFSQVAIAEENPIEQFIIGNYFVVGKHLDSQDTYSGEVSFTKSKTKGLQVVRNISGQLTQASAAIEQASSDKVPVLRIRYSIAGKAYEETCIVASDLNNYARITCHIYQPGIQTTNPGMEALFIQQSPQ